MPLGVYVHWPYCRRICPYCDFNVVRDRGRNEQQQSLVDALVHDLEAQRQTTGPRRLVSIFFGGGTPSLMDPSWTGRLVAAARDLWDADEDLEVTLEANPTDAEAERFAGFAAAGVGRLSLGAQSFDEGALAFLGRNHGAAEALRAAERARAAFPRRSIDLIYARPGQTQAAWTRDLETAVALGPEHISPYQLTIESGTAFGRAVDRGRWAPPDPDLAAALYGVTQAVLQRHGFDAYEVSNHARGDAARSRHNLLYWRGHDYLGVGPGAHGRITLERGRIATRAATGVADYIRRVGETGRGWESCEDLTPLQVAEERLLTGLRTSEGVALAELRPLSLARLADLIDARLVERTAERLTVTTAGRLVLDRLTAELAA